MPTNPQMLEEALDVALACAGELARASCELSSAEHAHDMSTDKRRSYPRLRRAREALAHADRRCDRARARMLELMGANNS